MTYDSSPPAISTAWKDATWKVTHHIRKWGLLRHVYGRHTADAQRMLFDVVMLTSHM